MMLLHLAGHSGAGKTRLLTALPARGVTAPRAVLCTSRLPRDAEIHGRDYYFLTRGAVAALPRESFFVGPVREQLQAVDLVQLEEDLKNNLLVLVEIHPTLWPGLKQAMTDRLGDRLRTASVFMTAVDPEAIRAMPDNDARGRYIRTEVERTLTWRAKDSSASIGRRVASAVGEILKALGLDGRTDYDRVLHSSPEGPDGQDDWTRGGAPVGRAGRALDEFVQFVEETRNA
jgi:hypothetical protein